MSDYMDIQYEDSVSSDSDEYQSHGWPGDGSGEDDLADYNANEADDYRDEGYEDSDYDDDCGYAYDGE